MKALPIAFLISILVFVPSSYAAEDLRESIATDYDDNL
jgi:hypothetical protein